MHFLKHYEVEGNTEATAQKCFIKISVLKNILKNLQVKTPVGRHIYRPGGAKKTMGYALQFI